MEDLFLTILSSCLGLIGFFGHVVSKWAEYRTNMSSEIGLLMYVRKIAPARSLLAFTLTVAGVGMLLGMEWLNPVAGFTAGWSSNSLIDNVTKRANL